ncbi:MAG: hypothetical protein U0821_06760 [Chloroflexota bacterium]
MIYILNTYDDDAQRLRVSREELAWPRLRAEGAVPLCLWRIILGDRPGRVLELLRFDSLAHWAQVTQQDTDPPESATLVHSVGLKPASRRHPGGQPQPVRAGSVWALRWMQTAPNQMERMVAISEDVFWAKTQTNERQTTLGMLFAHAADRREIMMLTHYDSLAYWESTREGRAPAARSEVDAEESRAALRDRNDLVVAQGVRLLLPISSIGPYQETITHEGGGR